jgi:hypothetical protein
MMLRQAHSISWVVVEGTFCGSMALCVTEKVALDHDGDAARLWACLLGGLAATSHPRPLERPSRSLQRP